MKPKFTKQELLELESQLSNPTGKKGIEIAKKMHESNFSMTKFAVDLLDIESNNTVLEIGHGSCEHLHYVLNKAEKVTYTGLEISKTMQELSIQKLNNLARPEKVSFDLYDGEHIVYPNNSFDKIFTVNTLYFWKNPLRLLKQIAEILKPNGKFLVAFANKDFMEELPFVQGKFKLYNRVSFQELVNNTHFSIDNYIQNKEEVLSKTNEKVKRDRLFFILSKRNNG